jgi:hypothetical protein
VQREGVVPGESGLGMLKAQNRLTALSFPGWIQPLNL